MGQGINAAPGITLSVRLRVRLHVARTRWAVPATMEVGQVRGLGMYNAYVPALSTRFGSTNDLSGRSRNTPLPGWPVTFRAQGRSDGRRSIRRTRKTCRDIPPGFAADARRRARGRVTGRGRVAALGGCGLPWRRRYVPRERELLLQGLCSEGCHRSPALCRGRHVDDNDLNDVHNYDNGHLDYATAAPLRRRAMPIRRRLLHPVL
jgi:hypothetical protein